MITEQQLLSIDLTTDEGKQELSRVAGEVLQPETKVHNELGPYIEHYFTSTCSKCSRPMLKAGVPNSFKCEDYGKPCKYADPIPLTWQEAMKWRKHTNDHLPLLDRLIALKDIGMIYNKTYSKYLEWWALEAQPEHYILAAVLCKIRSK